MLYRNFGIHVRKTLSSQKIKEHTTLCYTAQVSLRNPEALPAGNGTSQGASTSGSPPGLWTECPPGLGENFL